MKKLIVTLIAVVAFAVCANAANYKVDDSAIDALIADSVELVEADFAAATPAAASVSASQGKSSTTAFLLCTFLAWFAVHRYYLGTAPWMGLVYFLTGGGLGIVSFVDWLLLAFDMLKIGEGGYLNKFINNRKFLAWI